MVLQGAVRGLGVETIITSKIEHHAVIHAVESLEQSDDINVHYVQVSSDGSPDLADLERLLQHDDSKKLVSLMHVNNELGRFVIWRQSESLPTERCALSFGYGSIDWPLPTKPTRTTHRLCSCCSS